MPSLSRTALFALLAAAPLLAAEKAEPLNVPPKGFTALFNGKNLDNWQICIELLKRNKLKAEGGDAYEKAVKAANAKHLKHWTIKDGVLSYDGKGFSLQTIKDYGDFELLIDWKIEEKGDSGLYLRGQPQVQIWDSDNSPGARGIDKGSGSGGLWNNPLPKGVDPRSIGKVPIKKADKKPGEWNTFRIIMKGDKATVYLNGVLVVDNKALANYWERGKPLPATGPIELQHHGDKLWFRNIFIRELKKGVTREKKKHQGGAAFRRRQRRRRSTAHFSTRLGGDFGIGSDPSTAYTTPANRPAMSFTSAFGSGVVAIRFRIAVCLPYVTVTVCGLAPAPPVAFSESALYFFSSLASFASASGLILPFSVLLTLPATW
jgi:hypothetical protein